MVKKEYICIVCPNSCRLEVTDDHGRLTTTVNIEGGTHRRLPVISACELPRDKMEDCLKVLYSRTLKAPVACGQVIEQNICGTGVDIVASRSMKERG